MRSVMVTQTKEPTAAVHGVRRSLALASAAAVAVATLLPWVTVKGRLPLDLTVLSADVSAGGRTVRGLDTAAWPYLLGVAGLALLLAAFGTARRVLQGLGALTLVAGAGLLYYLSHVVDIQTANRSAVERAAADLAVSTSVGPGPYVLLAAGAGLILATLGRRASRH
jgi:hypothetical protein